ncbi:MAG: hypothetical protein HY551_01335 [Elusimicrobia bacterium]|nr:hypothetical protein [Elusimicrobiota bacterium]
MTWRAAAGLLLSCAALAQARPGAPGQALFFSVEERLPDLYAASGQGVRLDARRTGFPPFARYEVTGTFLGQSFDPSKPLTLRREDFGGSSKVLVEGPEILASFEAVRGFDETRVELKPGPGFKPELAAALAGILDLIGELRGPGGRPFSSTPSSFSETGTAGSPAPAAGGNAPAGGLSYRFREAGAAEFFYAEGRDMSLRIERRPLGSVARYEALGRAFGRDFGYGKDPLMVELDGNFLGPRGYRIEGQGIRLQARDDAFGGRRRLEFSGTLGADAGLALFSISLARHILSR